MDQHGVRDVVDVVIIGAGVIGAATALELSRLGYRTVNVDQLHAAGHGSTSASAGIIRTYALSRDAVVLAAEALPYWHQWSDYLDLPADAARPTLRVCGSLVLDDTPGYLDALTTNLESADRVYERWTTDEIAHHFPFLDTRSFGPPASVEDPLFWSEPAGHVAGGLYLPDSGYISDPALAAQNLQWAARQHGACFRFGSLVVEIVKSSGRTAGVRLQNGDFIASKVVINVAGPHSARINAMAGVLDGMRVRTRALRQELHHVACPDELDFSTRGVHIADADLGINFRPEVGNAILVGSNGAAVDPQQFVDDPDAFVPTVTRAPWERHTLRLARRIPSVGVPTRPAGVAGLYDVSDDWLPIYDTSDLPGFYMAIGTSGNQFKTAPVVGLLMASLVDACENGRDHDRDPLTLRRGGTRDIAIGTYSRRREIDDRAALSVNG